jgi:hypothetical protein
MKLFSCGSPDCPWYSASGMSVTLLPVFSKRFDPIQRSFLPARLDVFLEIAGIPLPLNKRVHS